MSRPQSSDLLCRVTVSPLFLLIREYFSIRKAVDRPVVVKLHFASASTYSFFILSDPQASTILTMFPRISMLYGHISCEDETFVA